ncbi:MAG: hypothetical protein EA393_13375 [Bacteroidetes bacterium]|nr:MAG: hypothetical protein EA393_13375 [Bacteroidota bacterium]
MPDFTLKIYKQLLAALQDAGYRFITFEEYMRKKEDRRQKTEESRQKVEAQIADSASHQDHPSPITHHPSPIVILRHDVDLLPQNSLAFARIQHEMGIRGSYYFRTVPESWDENIIKEIYKLGHEVGYHYEDMDLAGKNETAETWNETEDRRPKTEAEGESPKSREPKAIREPESEVFIDNAIRSFEKNLQKLQQLVPVSTICMHGSPRSRFDNRDLWKKYDYRDFGIIGEPYFDVDFDEMFYLTDTGRRWDGWRVSIRDKMPRQQEWIRQGLVFRSTREIIERVKSQSKHKDFPASEGSENVPIEFPTRIMMTFHPQRWTNKPVPWVKELMMQSAKNVVKYFINLRRGSQ